MHRQLRDLRNVGRAILADLHLLGIETVARFARESPADYFAVWKGQPVSGMTHVFETFLLT
jgi:hypothetical protein